MQLDFSDLQIDPSNYTGGEDRLAFRIKESVSNLVSAFQVDDIGTWIVMYSGGKDSTVTLLLAIEAAKICKYQPKLHVIFSNTGVEIPSMLEHAESFLAALALSHSWIKIHTVGPVISENFWVLVAGKGYPPPNQSFRWCTDKLKVKPAEEKIRNLVIPGRTAILTGVRFGESDARDKRLNLSCSRGGECSHGQWVSHSGKLQCAYIGPIVAWRECDVWDFLDFIAPSLGFETGKLKAIYSGPDTRFGCWSCSVVKRDKAMEKIVLSSEGRHWAPLNELRNWLIEFAKVPENRVKRPNGATGRFTLEGRQEILRKITEAEQRLSVPIVSDEQRELIQSYWTNPEYGNSYLE